MEEGGRGGCTHLSALSPAGNLLVAEGYHLRLPATMLSSPARAKTVPMLGLFSAVSLVSKGEGWLESVKLETER